MSMPLAVVMFLVAQIATYILCKQLKSNKPLIILYIVMMNAYNMVISYFLYGGYSGNGRVRQGVFPGKGRGCPGQ